MSFPAHWILGRTRMRDRSGCTGTVVYVGPVASARDASTIYAGVVWDDYSRGKHDGSVIDHQTQRMVRHFTAPHPTAGSFVKLAKLDTGVELTPGLLEERYVALNSEECVAPENILPHRAQTVSGRNDKVIELVGEFKIRSHQQLQDMASVSLRRWGISSVSAVPEWSKLDHLTHVDLAGNLLWDWRQVNRLLQSLPRLQNLSLASNRLGDIRVEAATNQQKSEDESVRLLQSSVLTQLNLRQTNIKNMESVLEIGRAFPNLKELSLADCPLDIQVDNASASLAKHFEKLEILDCSNCQLDSVEPWRKLPSLESLSLNENSKLADFNGVDPSQDFPALQHIQLSSTAFDDWLKLTRPLFSLPFFCRLRLTNCPVQAGMGRGQARIVTVAHLPALESLNGSLVTATERSDAARWYVRRSLQKQSESDSGSCTEHDPVLATWMEKYPELTEQITAGTAASATSSAALMDSIVNVTIRSMAASSCTVDPLVRRLPLQLSVGRVKALCARHFGLDIDLQVLQYTTGGLASDMDGDDRPLAYFGVPDGAEILMKEVDLEELQREEELAASELQNRLQRQEKEFEDFQERQKLSGATRLK